MKLQIDRSGVRNMSDTIEYSIEFKSCKLNTGTGSTYRIIFSSRCLIGGSTYGCSSSENSGVKKTPLFGQPIVCGSAIVAKGSSASGASETENGE